MGLGDALEAAKRRERNSEPGTQESESLRSSRSLSPTIELRGRYLRSRLAPFNDGVESTSGLALPACPATVAAWIRFQSEHGRACRPYHEPH